MNSKRSRLQRKYINAMNTMADVPKSARAYRYPPTFANAIGSSPSTLIGTCKRPVGSVKMRHQRLGRLRRRREVEVRCGGNVYLRRGSLGRRRVTCADCRDRKRAAARQLRVERQLTQRFGITRPVAADSKFKRFLRKAGK